MLSMVPARKLVIVVDDDFGVLKAIGRLLKARGFECELFSSVQDFRDRARLDRAMCLILDVNLNGESGIDLRRKLSETWPSIPVIFITANNDEGSRRTAMEAGCLAFLPKPFSANSLMGAVGKASAESPCQSPLASTASAPPRRVMSLVSDLPFIDPNQAEQERVILREERQEIWLSAEETIFESKELLRQADLILASHNSTFVSRGRHAL
jgi:FixJ family two-component response regulator